MLSTILVLVDVASLALVRVVLLRSVDDLLLVFLLFGGVASVRQLRGEALRLNIAAAAEEDCASGTNVRKLRNIAVRTQPEPEGAQFTLSIIFWRSRLFQRSRSARSSSTPPRSLPTNVTADTGVQIQEFKKFFLLHLVDN